MLTLYPEISAYQEHRIRVQPPHELYAEESGNPDGIPVLFVHGGPGGGCSANDRRFFDPSLYRIILFDQRGSGHSRPHASLEHNSTTQLVEDMEVIRETLGIEKWMLFGGSWGSTLSLIYAETHPKRVTGMILRGIFLCRSRDIHWFYQEGTSRLFPDYHDAFIKVVPEDERNDVVNSYYRQLTSSNELEKMAAAKAWSIWEGRCATLRPNTHVVDDFAEPHKALSLARIEAHYFVNNAFIAENQIIDQADRLADIPGIIIHGRYDVICPLDNAYALQQAWPKADLQIIRDAGHSSSEPGIIDALVRATRHMAQGINPA